jgi:hypothetical protein
MDVKNKIWVCDLTSYGLEYGLVADFYEHANKCDRMETGELLTV